MCCPMSALCRAARNLVPGRGRTLLPWLQDDTEAPHTSAGGPMQLRPGASSGACRLQCCRRYLASLWACARCASLQSSPFGSHSGASCLGPGPGAPRSLLRAEGPRAAAGSGLGPSLCHAALLIQAGVHVSPTEAFHEESLSHVSVTFRSFTILGWFRTCILLISGRNSWKLEKLC